MSARVLAIDYQVKDYTSDASWRTDRLTQWEVYTRIIENVYALSPLFSFPWFDIEIIRLDWLHVVDQGVAADFLGNLFYCVMQKLPGNSRKERCQSLWELIQVFYDKKDVQDRLQTLIPTMVRQGNKAPKLRGGAAVVRALVPFAVVLAESTLSNTDERERTMITAAKHLNDCYKRLSADEFHGLGLKENAIRFAGTYIALSQTSTDQKLWRVKPKMHLFLELCDGSVEPSKIWTYRDEDFLGGVWLQCRAGAAAS